MEQLNQQGEYIAIIPTITPTMKNTLDIINEI
jgi:hypothetical protein